MMLPALQAPSLILVVALRDLLGVATMLDDVR
jgi:hypothetical protein